MKLHLENSELVISKISFCFFIFLFTLYPLSLQAAPTTISSTVSSGNDDAEEQNVTGSPPGGGTMYQDSSDLELVYDGGTRQVVGVRFTSVAIKQGASSITDATFNLLWMKMILALPIS